MGLIGCCVFNWVFLMVVYVYMLLKIRMMSRIVGMKNVDSVMVVWMIYLVVMV